jgi:hypothetical protein
MVRQIMGILCNLSAKTMRSLLGSGVASQCFAAFEAHFQTAYAMGGQREVREPGWDILRFLDQYDSNGLRNRGWRERFGCWTRMVG